MNDAKTNDSARGPENGALEHNQAKPKPPIRLLIAAGVLAAAVLVFVLAVSAQGRGGGQSILSANLGILIPASFAAGVLSFLSPCTLPILPAYFAFTFQASRQNVVQMTVSFFLGLATTLTVLGASATAVSLVLLQNLNQLTLVGGLVIMVFGVLSLLGKGFSGPQIQERPASTALGSYLYGATFALGWTACVGPILGAILTLLATQGVAVAQGAVLAFAYALGLGLPLILVSTFFSRMGQGSRFWKVLRGRGINLRLGNFSYELHSTNVISGLLLIAMGYLLASGQLTLITNLAAGSDISIWVVEMEERLRTLFGLR